MFYKQVQFSPLGWADAARRGGCEDPNMRGATPSNDHRQLGGLDTPPSNYHRQLGGLDPPPSNYH